MASDFDSIYPQHRQQPVSVFTSCHFYRRIKLTSLASPSSELSSSLLYSSESDATSTFMGSGSNALAGVGVRDELDMLWIHYGFYRLRRWMEMKLERGG